MSAMDYECANCGLPCMDLGCSQCNLVRYCDRKCQTDHWNKEHHRDCLKHVVSLLDQFDEEKKAEEGCVAESSSSCISSLSSSATMLQHQSECRQSKRKHKKQCLKFDKYVDAVELLGMQSLQLLVTTLGIGGGWTTVEMEEVISPFLGGLNEGLETSLGNHIKMKIGNEVIDRKDILVHVMKEAVGAADDDLLKMIEDSLCSKATEI